MAIDTPARHIYSGDGSTRVFPIPTYIQGDDYIRIEINGVHQVDRSKWDIVNNSIIFVTAPITTATIDVQVATSVEALTELGSVTNVDIVAANIIGISSVASNLDEILLTKDNAIIATTKASEASASATIASSGATTATTKANEASTSAINALASENKAKKWADESVDVPVESGLYSAKHWAAKASAIVVYGLIDDVSPSTSTVFSSTRSNNSYEPKNNNIQVHISNNTTNPHNVTKNQVGLSNVDNTSDVNKPISTATTTALANKLDKSGGTMTGAITAIRETKVAMATNNIDLATGNLFTKTITTATTLTISNALAAGNVNSFVLELTNGGSAVITWFSGVKWAGGTAPTLTTSGKDILGFYSHDGGTTWNILGINKDVK